MKDNIAVFNMGIRAYLDDKERSDNPFNSTLDGYDFDTWYEGYDYMKYFCEEAAEGELRREFRRVIRRDLI